MRLSGIPIIVLIIQHVGLDFREILEYVEQYYYYHNLLFNFSLCTFLWMLTRRVIHWFDNRSSWRDNLGKRMIRQISSTIFLNLLLAHSIAYLYAVVWMESTLWETYWHTDLPMAVLLTLILNLYYLGIQLHQKQNTVLPDSQIATETLNTISPIQMNWRGKTILSPSQEIVLFSTQDRLTFAWLRDGRRMVVDQNIKELREHLPSDQFFLANRKYLIQKSYIKAYRRGPTRKLILSLESQPEEIAEITVSKALSPAFLKWLSV